MDLQEMLCFEEEYEIIDIALKNFIKRKIQENFKGIVLSDEDIDNAYRIFQSYSAKLLEEFMYGNCFRRIDVNLSNYSTDSRNLR